MSTPPSPAAREQGCTPPPELASLLAEPATRVAFVGADALAIAHGLGVHGRVVTAPGAAVAAGCERCNVIEGGWPASVAEGEALDMFDAIVVGDPVARDLLRDRELLAKVSARCRRLLAVAVPLAPRRAAAVFGDGFYFHPEHQGEHAWYWCVGRDGTARTEVHLLDPDVPSPLQASIRGRLLAAPPGGQAVSLWVDGALVRRFACPGSFSTKVTLSEHSVLEWRAEPAPLAPVPGDGRWLSFAVADLTISAGPGDVLLAPAQAYVMDDPSVPQVDEYVARTLLHGAGWLGVGGWVAGAGVDAAPRALAVTFGSPHVPGSTHQPDGIPYPGTAMGPDATGWLVGCAAEGLALEALGSSTPEGTR